MQLGPIPSERHHECSCRYLFLIIKKYLMPTFNTLSRVLVDEQVEFVDGIIRASAMVCAYDVCGSMLLTVGVCVIQILRIIISCNSHRFLSC